MATMMIFQTSPPPHSFMYFLPDNYYYYVEILGLALSPPLSDTTDVSVPIPMPMPMPLLVPPTGQCMDIPETQFNPHSTNLA